MYLCMYVYIYIYIYTYTYNNGPPVYCQDGTVTHLNCNRHATTILSKTTQK